MKQSIVGAKVTVDGNTDGPWKFPDGPWKEGVVVYLVVGALLEKGCLIPCTAVAWLQVGS